MKDMMILCEIQGSVPCNDQSHVVVWTDVESSSCSKTPREITLVNHPHECTTGLLWALVDNTSAANASNLLTVSAGGTVVVESGVATGTDSLHPKTCPSLSAFNAFQVTRPPPSLQNSCDCRLLNRSAERPKRLNSKPSAFPTVSLSQTSPRAAESYGAVHGGKGQGRRIGFEKLRPQQQTSPRAAESYEQYLLRAYSGFSARDFGRSVHCPTVFAAGTTHE